METDKNRAAADCRHRRCIASVAAAAQFLLLFLYSLHEVTRDAARLRLFQPSDRGQRHPKERDVEEAIPEILEKIGFRSTDYGRALEDFEDLHMDALDRHTTVIILGDGRSNDTDPRMDLMRQIHDRAKSVIWLNPEPEPSGALAIPRCTATVPSAVAKTCSTVQDLERVVDDVMKTYFRV